MYLLNGQWEIADLGGLMKRRLSVQLTVGLFPARAVTELESRPIFLGQPHNLKV